MPTIGKHTGTGKLVCADPPSGRLLYDENLGRLLWDGNVYINEDPPQDEEDQGEGYITKYWGLYQEWFGLKQSSGDTNYGWETSEAEARNWLHSFYAAAISAELQSQPSGNPPSGDGNITCGQNGTSARVVHSSCCYSEPRGSLVPYSQTQECYRFVIHYFRVRLEYTGTYPIPMTARFRVFDDGVPPMGVYGGPVFCDVSSSGRFSRYVHVPAGITIDNPDRFHWPAAVTMELKPARLPYVPRVSGSASLYYQDISMYGTSYYRYI